MDPITSFERRVHREIADGQLLSAGEAVVVAVSGGADSMSLLAVLQALGARHGFALDITIAHFDHGLRGEESASDADFVRATGAALGLPVVVDRCTTLAVSSSNLEARAREARFGFLRDVATNVGATAIAVGHTREDQAETVLHRLARGAGVRSLAGMEMKRSDGVIRPLLLRRRAECIDYLSARGIGFVEDSTNRASRFTRNRIRRDVLPHLSEALDVDMVERLSTAAEQLRVEADLADDQIRARLSVQEARTLAVRDVVEVGPAAGRLLHAWLASIGLRPSRVQVAALVDLARSGGPSAGVDLEGVRVERDYEVLRLRPPTDAALEAAPLVWDPRRDLELPSGWRLSTEELAGADHAGGADQPVIDAAAVSGGLMVRTLQAGDRIRLSAGRRKLSDLFIDRKIPRVERRRLAVVARGADIIWVPGVAVATDVLPGERTERWMRLRAERADCRHFGSMVENQAFRVRFG